jgi:2'-5' RNA ligase
VIGSRAAAIKDHNSSITNESTIEDPKSKMHWLIALDVAILPPPIISTRAIELSGSLPEQESLGLRLGGDAIPHITLTQQFVPAEALDAVLDTVALTLTGAEPLCLMVTGAGGGQSAVWMAIEPAPILLDLHRRLMTNLAAFERQDGSPAAFVDHDARRRDVAWVAGFRRSASYEAFTPHITLGHAAMLPRVESMTFEATTIAACQLGRFCTCRHVFRRWEL